MIGQYLPQTNESATVPKTFQFSELNKALGAGNWAVVRSRVGAAERRRGLVAERLISLVLVCSSLLFNGLFFAKMKSCS